MRYGYNGKILHVDLTSSDLTVETPPEDFYRKYMGGSALNMHYILRDMPAGVDPLAPENVLAFSIGVTTGTNISGQSRLTVSAKSPLTGAIGDSQSGGYFPAKMKWAGFDAIIVKGKSDKPVYLWIDDGKAELRDASHLWGKITGEVQAAIRAELGEPAGEKHVRYAAIINMCNRANGRTGMGAVMGSKNLKAIALRGSKKPELADKKALSELSKWGGKNFAGSMVEGLGKYGTAGAIVSAHSEEGGLPTYNYTSGCFDGHKKLDGTTMYETVLAGAKVGKQDTKGRETCYSCVIRCKRVVDIPDGDFVVDPNYGGPEYETVATFGSYCGNDNLAAVCKANELCNQYGLDTITCGATIAWAMEAFEAGVLTKDDTGGMEIKFGDAEAFVKLVEMIAKRDGVGDLLAEGSAKAAEKLGKGTEFLITTKGLEAPAHMPHVKRVLGLIYAVNAFGSDHESSDHDPSVEGEGFDLFKDRLESIGIKASLTPMSLNAGKVEFARKTQYICSLMDSLNLCQFAWGTSWQLYGPQHMVDLVKAVTGWDVTMEELLVVGERRVNMLRAFNTREGFDRSQDKLPEKFFDIPLKGGATDGVKLDRGEYEAALTEYYTQSGWDENGRATRETLTRLGLAWIVDNS